MSENSLDLAEYVSGFPQQPDVEVPRDAIIRKIIRDLSSSRQLMVAANAYTGKTNLLAQFVRSHKDSAISYFINSNPWTQQQHNFLHTLCSQLRIILGGKAFADDISLEMLKTVFSSQCAKLAEIARTNKTIYYFIIDGLEWALEGLEGERIIDIFPPPTFPRSPFLLCSCTTNYIGSLPKHILDIKRLDVSLDFNLSDTQYFFSNLNLPSDVVESIHQNSQGIPEYLSIIKNDIMSNRKEQWKPDNLPTQLDQLIQRQLDKFYSSANHQVKKAFEYLAVTSVPLPVDTLCGICNIEQNTLVQQFNEHRLTNNDNKTNEISLSNQIIREVSNRKLGSRVSKLRQELVDFVKTEPNRKEFLLTILLREAQDYEGVKSLLTNNVLISTVNNTSNITLLAKRLSLASSLALNQDDIPGLLRFTLAEVILRSLVREIDEEGEIRALIAIGESHDAITKAYRIPEISARIRLLAKAYTSIRERGERIPSEARDELASMVSSLKLDEIEKDVVKEIALEIFPILQDESVQLLDKLIGQSERQGVLDAAYTSIALNSRGKPSANIISAIQDTRLKYFVRMYSNWLQDLSIQTLVRELSEVETTSAKEYMIRQWCNQNHDSIELPQGIDLWIDTIVSDLNFTVPLSSIRSITSLLITVDNISERKRLIERIEIPGITLLDSPKEEWIRFQLNLAAAYFSIDHEESNKRVCAIHQSVENRIFDPDVKVFCLAQIWATASKYFSDDHEFINKLSTSFEETFEHLLNNTGEHLEIFRESIRTLVDIDPNLAAEKALKLNIYERRLDAISEVLEKSIREYHFENMATFIETCLVKFDTLTQDFILVSILSNLRTTTVELSENNLTYLLNRIGKISDPIQRSQCLASMLKVVKALSQSSTEIMVKSSINAWRQEEDLKLRISYGFSLVEDLAEIDLASAKSLCFEIQELYLQPGSALAISHLGNSYYQTLELAIRSLDLDGVRQEKGAASELENFIDRIPSKRIRIQLFAQLCARSYTLDYPPLAAKLIRLKILPQIRELATALDEYLVIKFALPVLYKYDHQTAIELTRKFSRVVTDQMWTNVIAWLIVKDDLTNSFDFETLWLPNDHPVLNDCIEVLGRIKRDHLIYGCVRLISNCIDVSHRDRRVDALQALSLLNKLENYAKENLPDDDNIPHEGYKLISLSAIHATKSCIYDREKYRRGMNKLEIQRIWLDINNWAKNIPNAHDRIYVYCTIAKDIARHKLETANKLLQEADRTLLEVPSLIDRVTLQEMIGSTWATIGEKSLAEFTFEKTVELLDQLKLTIKMSRPFYRNGKQKQEQDSQKENF